MSNPRTPTYEQLSALCAQMAAALEECNKEATMSNNIIRMGWPSHGQGRVKIGTSLHRVEKQSEKALTAYRTLSPDPQWQPGETFPRDNEPFLYWDDDCAIPETVAFLNGSKIAQHGLYPYAGGGWFVSEERAKSGWWRPLPKPPARARGEG